MGVVLNKHRDKDKTDKTTAAHAEVEAGKRKRRPPSWMSATEWMDEEGHDEAPTSDPNLCRRRAAPLATIAAAMDDGRSKPVAAAPPVCICVYGIVPPAVSSERERAMQERLHASRRPSLSGNSMPPPLHVSSERSPRLPGQGSRSPRDRSAGGPSPRLRPKQDGFAVYFGDLPSPRIIEVIKAKEVLLPGWRTTAKPPRPAAGLAGGGGPVSGAAAESSGEEEGEATSDEAFERRHTRTLERAILAARTVARDMAMKERERKQAAAHAPASEEVPGGKGAPEDEDWKFRPSELAALCAAASMNWSGDGEAQAVGSSSAGFFGMGGANRGADNEKKAGEANKKGEAAPGGGGGAGSAGAAAARGEGVDDGASEDGGMGRGYESEEEEAAGEAPLVCPPEADALIDSIRTPAQSGMGEPGASNGNVPMEVDASPMRSPMGESSGREGSSPIDEIEGEVDEMEGEIEGESSDEAGGEGHEVYAGGRGGYAPGGGRGSPSVGATGGRESGESGDESSAYEGVEMESGEGSGEEEGEEEEEEEEGAEEGEGEGAEEEGMEEGEDAGEGEDEGEEDGPGGRNGGWHGSEQDELSASGDE
jgi:hypothetical protein